MPPLPVSGRPLEQRCVRSSPQSFEGGQQIHGVSAEVQIHRGPTGAWSPEPLLDITLLTPANRHNITKQVRQAEVTNDLFALRYDSSIEDFMCATFSPSQMSAAQENFIPVFFRIQIFARASNFSIPSVLFCTRNSKFV